MPPVAPAATPRGVGVAAGAGAHRSARATPSTGRGRTVDGRPLMGQVRVGGQNVVPCEGRLIAACGDHSQTGPAQFVGHVGEPDRRTVVVHHGEFVRAKHPGSPGQLSASAGHRSKHVAQRHDRTSFGHMPAGHGGGPPGTGSRRRADDAGGGGDQDYGRRASAVQRCTHLTCSDGCRRPRLPGRRAGDTADGRRCIAVIVAGHAAATPADTPRHWGAASPARGPHPAIRPA